MARVRAWMAAGFCAAALLACAGNSATLSPLEPQAGRGTRKVGWVRTQRVDLLSLRAQLEVASGCRRSPEPTRDAAVLRRAEVVGAACRTRAFEGLLPVYAVLGDGELRGPLWREEVHAGALSLRFTQLEVALRASGLDPASVVSLELGEAGWAGTLAFDRLREFLGRWHYAWVRQGRGSASLYVAAHPDDPRAREAKALAVEAQLARQERDYLDVGAGRLSTRQFLERHLWSPYRASVLRLEDRAIRAAGP